MTTHLFCEECGDSCKAVFPCKFVYYDGLAVDVNVCPDCMTKGTLTIDLSRKRLVAKILGKLSKR